TAVPLPHFLVPFVLRRESRRRLPQPSPLASRPAQSAVAPQVTLSPSLPRREPAAAPLP
ncbi:hypothetical protein HAX54_010220, partial [Datura stramonium]|nr:hypothetical protein [Datura stramonium]